MTNRHQLPLALIAALLATCVLAAPAGADQRHRRGPGHADADRVRALEASLAQAQSDLAYYQKAYAALEDGLTRIESAAQSNRKNVLNRILKIATNARSTAAQYVLPANPVVTAPAAPAYGNGYDAYGNSYDAYGNPTTGYPTNYPTSAPSGHGVYQWNTQGHGPSQAYVSVQPLDGQGYAQLRQSMNNALDSARLEIMRAVTPSTALSVDQLVDLMSLCSFDSTRIEIAALAYPTILDARSWYRVYEGLTFSASRTTLRNRIGQ